MFYKDGDGRSYQVEPQETNHLGESKGLALFVRIEGVSKPKIYEMDGLTARAVRTAFSVAYEHGVKNAKLEIRRKLDL